MFEVGCRVGLRFLRYPRLYPADRYPVLPHPGFRYVVRKMDVFQVGAFRELAVRRGCHYRFIHEQSCASAIPVVIEDRVFRRDQFLSVIPSGCDRSRLSSSFLETYPIIPIQVSAPVFERLNERLRKARCVDLIPAPCARVDNSVVAAQRVDKGGACRCRVEDDDAFRSDSPQCERQIFG